MFTWQEREHKISLYKPDFGVGNKWKLLETSDSPNFNDFNFNLKVSFSLVTVSLVVLSIFPSPPAKVYQVTKLIHSYLPTCLLNRHSPVSQIDFQSLSSNPHVIYLDTIQLILFLIVLPPRKRLVSIYTCLHISVYTKIIHIYINTNIFHLQL